MPKPPYVYPHQSELVRIALAWENRAPRIRQVWSENMKLVTTNSDIDARMTETLSNKILAAENTAVREKIRLDMRGQEMTYDIDVWHPALHSKIDATLRDMMFHVLDHFTPRLSMYEAHKLFASPEERELLAKAGDLVGPANYEFRYKINDQVGIFARTFSGTRNYSILLPKEIYDKEGVFELTQPLISLSGGWLELLMAFEKMPEMMGNTREMNVYFPWLKLMFQHIRVFDERVMQQWFGNNLKPRDMVRIKRQVDLIRSGMRPNRFTWFPVELVNIAKQGTTLITQYNLLKDVTRQGRALDSYVELNSSTSSISGRIEHLMQKARTGQDPKKVTVDIEVQQGPGPIRWSSEP